jgi:hypothetical protein
MNYDDSVEKEDVYISCVIILHKHFNYCFISLSSHFADYTELSVIHSLFFGEFERQPQCSVFGNIDIKQVPLRLTVKLTFSN